MANIVEEFEQKAMQLVQECVDYAAANEYIEATDTNIRRVRVVTTVLLAALQQANAVAVRAPAP